MIPTVSISYHAGLLVALGPQTLRFKDPSGDDVAILGVVLAIHVGEGAEVIFSTASLRVLVWNVPDRQALIDSAFALMSGGG